MVTISDVAKIFAKKFGRRTITGLAKTLKTSKDNIKSVLDANPDIFIQVDGCKGKMYELKTKFP